jgi:NAD(P)-dependent dehydrogenase (short-subunit alcohol dehydrogenase family)
MRQPRCLAKRVHLVDSRSWLTSRLPTRSKEIFRQLDETHGRVDVLVNNAGLWSNIPALELSLAEWNRVLAVNLTGTLLCCLAGGRMMVDQGRGSIINISSVSGGLGFKNRVAYTASKHGVLGVTKSLANDWATRGVRVNAIAPGDHETEMTRAWRSDPEILENELLSRIPMGRLGQPEELVGALIFLASDASSYMTGQTLFSDGGWLLE